MNRLILVLGLLLAGATSAFAFDAKPKTPDPSPSVGVVEQINDLVLPGTRLEAKPLVDRQAKVVLRLVDVAPHGNAFRYQMSYYGLEPGSYDLRDYLQREDKTATADLPPIPVTVRAILAPGQIEPNRLATTPSIFRGHYRLTMFLAAVAWFVGLLALVFVGRRRRQTIEAANAQPPTLADRLRPLVAQAMAGTLPPQERANLERTLIDYWRRRLGLQDENPARAIALIRGDEQAGALLRELEAWLHQPPGSVDGSKVDLTRLLEPYRHLPAEAELAGAGTTSEGLAR